MKKTPILVLLFTLAFAHFINDWYSMCIPPIIPVIRKLYTINYFQAGILATMPYLAAAILQLPVAHFTEKRGIRKSVLIFGFLILAISYFLFSFSGTYMLMLITALFIGVGLSAYHPQAIGILSFEFKGRKGAALGIHGGGGSLGFAAGPIVVGLLFSWMGFKGLHLLVIPGIVMALLIFFLIHIEEKPITSSFKSAITLRILLIGFVAMVTPFFSRGVAAFMPAFLYYKGETLLMANLYTGFMLIVGVAAQPLGGFLSDILGRRTVIVTSYTLSGILLLLFVNHPCLSILIIYGFFVFLPVAVRHAFAAEAGGKKIDTNIAVMYTMVMLGSSISPALIGKLIDALGFEIAFSIITLVAFAGAALALFIKPVKNESI